MEGIYHAVVTVTYELLIVEYFFLEELKHKQVLRFDMYPELANIYDPYNEAWNLEILDFVVHYYVDADPSDLVEDAQ